MKQNPENVTALIRRINEVEKERALKITGDFEFQRWLKTFRNKHIIHRFLYPVYTRDDDYSRGKRRVEQFGDYILPEEQYGTIFYEGAQGWIRNEFSVFWLYLTDAMFVINLRATNLIPDESKVDNIPAVSIWEEISGMIRKLGLFGESGGGMYRSDRESDPNYMAEDDTSTAHYFEDNDGNRQLFDLPVRQNWITLFDHYRTLDGGRMGIEMRPAWFHIVNYALFNTLDLRLPIFYASFQPDLKLNLLRFLESNRLTHEEINIISLLITSIPSAIPNLTGSITFKREQRNMVWWLLNKIGSGRTGGRLTLGEIAQRETIKHRSAIQRGVGSMDKKLKAGIDRSLLGRLLKAGATVGLSSKKVYEYLMAEGLVPHREREIDSFDIIDELI